MKIKILLLVLLTFVLFQCKKDSKKEIESTKNNETAVVYTIKQGLNCFEEIIENEVSTTKNVKEINKLVINLEVEGEQVKGNFDYIPFKAKINKGIFTGKLDGNIATTICTFNQEGKEKKEEVIFKIEANKISILGGEKELIDGVWKFKDISKGFYMNEIPRINCN